MVSGSGAIFVSYRRAETRDIAGRLADRLMDRFGEDQVFVDVEDIEPGVDFVTEIERAVSCCRVLVVVIGALWHTVVGPGGVARLHDPHDAVAIEVRTALAAGIKVVPVLVNGAEMPPADAMPEPLRSLARINAARVDHESFRDDADRLLGSLERALGARPSVTPVSSSRSTARRLAGRTAEILGEAAVRSWQRRREEGLFASGPGSGGGRHAAPRRAGAGATQLSTAPPEPVPGSTPAPPTAGLRTAPQPQAAIVPGRSVAGVRLGATADEVRAVLGAPAQVYPMLEYPALGLYVRMDEGRVDGFFLLGRLHEGWATYRGTTPEGVAIGSTRTAVEAAYGPGTEHAKSDKGRSATSHPQVGLRFYYLFSHGWSDDVVQQILVRAFW